jgi:hypothetical protein
LLHIKLRNASILSPDAGAAKNDAALVGNIFCRKLILLLFHRSPEEKAEAEKKFMQIASG